MAFRFSVHPVDNPVCGVRLGILLLWSGATHRHLYRSFIASRSLRPLIFRLYFGFVISALI